MTELPEITHQKTISGNKSQLLGWLLFALLVVAVLASPFSQAPGLLTDVGTCISAVDQSQIGNSPDAFTSFHADPNDLRETLAQPLSWWPRSYGAIPMFVRQMLQSFGGNANWGTTIQVTVFIFMVIGISGWLLLFRKCVTADWLPWLGCAFILFRFSHANGYLYDGGEYQFWGVFPWILLLNLRAITSDLCCKGSNNAVATAAGICTALLVLLKYSAGLTCLGIASGWCFACWRHGVSRRRLLFFFSGAAISSVLIFAFGLMPSGNPTAQTAGAQLTPLLWAPGSWLLACSDLESLINRVFVAGENAILSPLGPFGDGAAGWLSIPLALFFVVMLVSYKSADKPGDKNEGQRVLLRDVIIVCCCVNVIALTLLLIRGSAIHMDARLIRCASIATLPWILSISLNLIRQQRIRVKSLGWVSLMLFIVGPALYGAATLVDKSLIRSAYAANQTGTSGIRHDVLDTDGNATEFFAELERLTADKRLILIIDPAMQLDLPNSRIFMEHLHLRTNEQLAAKQSYNHLPENGILIAAPSHLMHDGKLDTYMELFPEPKIVRQDSSSFMPDWELIYIDTP